MNTEALSVLTLSKHEHFVIINSKLPSIQNEPHNNPFSSNSVYDKKWIVNENKERNLCVPMYINEVASINL